MADISNVNEQTPSSTVEKTDRGLFDFMKKKPEAAETTTLASEFDHKAQVSEPVYKKEDLELEKEKENEKKHAGLLEKLHRSDSSSSSSSDEEGDDEEKKKRRKKRKEKKGLKDKLKEKLPGHKDHDDTNVPIEKYEEHHVPHVQENVYSEPSYVQGGVGSEHEKKGFVDKVKDKLPGSHPKPAKEHHVPHVQENVYSEPSHVQGGVGSEHEKKGFVDKIKDKLPGSHPKPTEEHHLPADSYVEADGKEKKGFLDKIKDKIPGLSSKSSDEKKEHEEHKKEGY